MADMAKQVEERAGKVKSSKVRKYVKEGMLKKIGQAGDGAAFWMERLEKGFDDLKPEGLMKGFEKADFDDLWFVLTGEKRRESMKKGCDDCGCGELLADSLIGPMSAEEKDAEAGPKEGPVQMAQPLRSRRDYGASSRKAEDWKKKLVDDFKEWSGGWGPDEVDELKVRKYIRETISAEAPEEAPMYLLYLHRKGRSASMKTADLVLSLKDKAVLDAFYKGEEAESGKLSTDGKTLDGNWMGGRELATRDSGGVVKPGKDRPHVKSDEVVLRALKKAVPSRYYKGSIGNYKSVVARVAESFE